MSSRLIDTWMLLIEGVPAVPHHRAQASRHARLDQQVTRIGLAVGALALAAGLLAQHLGDGTPVARTHLPTISITPPPPAERHTLSRYRAVRQAAKARPPVLLGPRRLSISMISYCEAATTRSTGASPTADGWRCDRPTAPQMIDMDAACRWLFDENAWAGMLDDDDAQTWRCYRDGP